MSKISPRRHNLVIKEWVREINGTKYKFRATYWLDANEAVFSVQRRQIRGWIEYHHWRVRDNKIVGAYYK